MNKTIKIIKVIIEFLVEAQVLDAFKLSVDMTEVYWLEFEIAGWGFKLSFFVQFAPFYMYPSSH